MGKKKQKQYKFVCERCIKKGEWSSPIALVDGYPSGPCSRCNAPTINIYMGSGPSPRVPK